METYTIKDYDKLLGEDRWELIKGVFHIFMSPAPQTYHQEISLELSTELALAYRKRKCKVYEAPFDVELAENTIVQPDLCIICDTDKITKKRCVGSPDFIAEIVSSSSFKRDTVDKLKLYEEYKIREYWLILMEQQEVWVYTLENDKYSEKTVYDKHQKIRLFIDPTVEIDFETVFNDN